MLETRVALDWQRWDKDERPRGAPREAALVLAIWIMGPDPIDPGLLFGKAQLEVIVRAVGADAAEVERYAAEHRGELSGSHQGPWKFWIIQHGGVEAVTTGHPSDHGEPTGLPVPHKSRPGRDYVSLLRRSTDEYVGLGQGPQR